MTNQLNIKAYTLVELIIVLVLLGILSAGIVPNLSLMSSFKSSFYQRQLIQAMRAAQRLAIASECHVAISISSSGYEVKIPVDSTQCSLIPNTANLSKFELKNDLLNGLEKSSLANAGDTQTCNLSTSIKSTSCTLYFNSTGQCFESNGTIISGTEPLIEINNGALKIKVVGETGYVYAS